MPGVSQPARRAEPWVVWLGSPALPGGIADRSGLRTCTPTKRRVILAIRRGACPVSSCDDGSCRMPSTGQDRIHRSGEGRPA